MSETLKEASEKLKTEFEKGINSELLKVPNDFANKWQKEFLSDLKKHTLGLLKTIDKKYPIDKSKVNSEINYKMKINILTDLNKFLKKYPTAKTKYKLDALKLLKMITSDLGDLKHDIIVENNAILPDKYLKDADFPGFEHISDKLEKADTLSITELNKKIKEIEISSDNIEKEDWDSFFEDLRDQIKDENELKIFDEKIKEFKEKSPLYSDSIAGVGGLNIEGLGKDIDTLVDKIDKLKNGEKITIDKGGIKVEFKTKQAALKYLYKMKLIFKELENTDIGLGFYLSQIWSLDKNIAKAGFGAMYENGLEDPIDAGLWGIGTIIALTGTTIIGGLAPLYIPAAITESILRNTTDVLAVNFGDKDWAKKVASFSEILKKYRTFIFQKGKFRKILLPTLLATYPFEKTSGAFSTILNKAEKSYLDAMLKDEKITIIDGLHPNDGKEPNQMEEFKKKVKVLDYYKKKWKNDPERIKKFERLQSPKNFFFGGELNSNTDTFWRKVYEIDKGELILTNKGIDKKDNILRRGKGLLNQGLKVLSFSQYEAKVLEDVNNGIEKARNSLKEVYNINIDTLDNIKNIDSLEKTDFYKYIKANVDFDGTLDDKTELKIEKRLDKYIQKLAQLEIPNISGELVKQDIMKISKGFIPHYEMVEEIKKEIENTNSKEIKDRLNTLIEFIENRKLDIKEGELYRYINDAKLGNPYSEKVVTFTKKEIKDFEKRGEKLANEDFRKFPKLLDLESYNKDIIVKKLLEKSKGNNNSIFNINDTSIKNTLEDFFDNKVNNTKLDWTKSHFNKIVRNIMEGMEYEEAIKPFTSETDFIDNEKKSPIRNNIVNEDIKILESNLKGKIKNIESSSISNNEKLEQFNELKETYFEQLKKSGISELDDLNKELSTKIANISFSVLKEEISDKKTKILNLENKINTINTEDLKSKTTKNLYSEIKANITTYKNELERIDNLKNSEINLDNLKKYREEILKKFNEINSKITKLETLIKIPIKDKKSGKNKKSPKQKTSPEKMDQKIFNIYAKASTYAEIHGKFNISDKLLEEYNKLDNSTISDLSKLEADIKNKIGLGLNDKIPSLKKLETELNRLDTEIKIELSKEGIDFSGKTSKEIRRMKPSIWKKLTKLI